MFLNSLNYFRGLAIVLIVAGHCFDLADIGTDTLADSLLRNVIAGGSCLFVFISGFLFHHVFYERFEYRRFLTTKAKNVLVPYLVLSAAPIAYFVASRKDHFGGMFLPDGPGWIAQFAVPYLKYLWTGVFFIPYWYIAFIMLMFALSPLHVAFIRLAPRVRLVVTLTWLLVAALVHRSVDNLNALQSVVYFTPVYLLGIVCSIHRDWVYETLTGRELWLLGAALVALIWQTLGVGHVGNFHKSALMWGGLDWVLIQKLFVCLLLLVFLRRFEERRWPVLALLASSSFGIYFLHAWVLAVAYLWKSGHPFHVSGAWFWLVATAAVLAVSVSAGWVVRRVLGKRSRFVIGW